MCGEAADDACGLVPVHTLRRFGDEDRTVVAFADSEIDRACRAGCEWDDDDLGVAAVYPQSVMTPLETQVVAVSFERLGRLQSARNGQARHRVVSCPGEPSWTRDASSSSIDMV